MDVNMSEHGSVSAVAEHGSPCKLLSCSVVKKKLMLDLKKEIGEYVANVKKSWNRTGCTLMSDIWYDKGRSFINIFGYSIEGMVLLRTFEIHELTTTFPWDILCSIAQDIEPNNIVQCLTNGSEGHSNHMFFSNYPHVYQTDCAAHKVHVLLNNIYNEIEWVQKAFDQARVVVTNIHKHDGILSGMKQFASCWELKQSLTTEFHSNYYMLQSIMEVEKKLRLLVSFGSEKDESDAEVCEIICSSEFWSEGKEVVHVLEPIFRVHCLVNSKGATCAHLYAAVEKADEAIRQIWETNVPKYRILQKIFKVWKRYIIHPFHAAAAFLNPAYMCREKFIENKAMKDGMDFISEKLVDEKEKKNFMREKLLYLDKVSKLPEAMVTSRISHPCDWWDRCGNDLPVLKKCAIRILSQPCSTSFCRQSLSAFKTAQTEKREPLMPAVMDNYLYLRMNALLMENFHTMKEKIRKPLDPEKRSELPDFTEFMNENFTRDLLTETKVQLSDGKLNCWLKMVAENLRQFLKRIGDRMASAAKTKDRSGSSVEPSSMEVEKQCSLSRPYCLIGNVSPKVRQSFGDVQEASCSTVNDAVSVPAGTSCLTRDPSLSI